MEAFEVAQLFKEYGVLTVVCIALVAVVTNLYKNQLNSFAQSRTDYIKREDELMKCFNNITITLKDINTTMRDTNTRLTIIEERLNNGG